MGISLIGAPLVWEHFFLPHNQEIKFKDLSSLQRTSDMKYYLTNAKAAHCELSEEFVIGALTHSAI